MRRHLRTLAAACIAVGATGFAQAGFVISDHQNGEGRDNFTGNVGIEFTLKANGFVTDLGYVDAFGSESGGLLNAHEVGLYNTLGELIVKATVPAGEDAYYLSQSPFSEGWRWVTLETPVAVFAGETYVISAEVFSGSGDPWGDSNPGAAPTVFDPNVVSDQFPVVARYSFDGGSPDGPAPSPVPGVEFPFAALGANQNNRGYNAGNVQIMIVETPVLPGDFNSDGKVDAADYTVWRDNLNAPTEDALNGAGNGLNGVDSGDYTLWAGAYGSTGAMALAVPEPTSLTAVVAALAASGLRRRTR